MKLSNCLPKWLYHFAFPTAMNENSCCSTSSPIFSAVRVFSFSHSYRCAWYLTVALICKSLIISWVFSFPQVKGYRGPELGPPRQLDSRKTVSEEEGLVKKDRMLWMYLQMAISPSPCMRGFLWFEVCEPGRVPGAKTHRSVGVP